MRVLEIRNVVDFPYELFEEEAPLLHMRFFSVSKEFLGGQKWKEQPRHFLTPGLPQTFKIRVSSCTVELALLVKCTDVVEYNSLPVLGVDHPNTLELLILVDRGHNLLVQDRVLGLQLDRVLAFVLTLNNRITL